MNEKLFEGVEESYILEICCNIDDMNGEEMGDLLEQAMKLGARDAWIESAVMKKSRPGFIFHILCKQEERKALLTLLFSQSTTWGVRETCWTRFELATQSESVQTLIGKARIKSALFQGKPKTKWEYEDLKQIARDSGLSIREVQRILEDELSKMKETKEKSMSNPVIDSIKSRVSTKSFQDKPVPKEMIEEIVEAGTFAPTGKNLQAPIILAITNKEIRDKLSKENARILGADIDPFYNAPVVLVVLADKNAPTYLYDGSVVMENLMLAANALGLGSCWIHRAKEEFEGEIGKEILKEAGIEGDYEGIGHCVIGYPAVEFKSKPRKENWVYYLD